MSSQLRGAGIIGTGSFAPSKVLTNADFEKIVDTSDEWIVTRTGIRQRHVAEPGVAASDLAFEASKKALEAASLSPEDIDLIICPTITADKPLPSTACILQDKLGIKNAPAFDLQAACAGWVYGFAVGTQFIQTGMYNHVLLVGVDVLTCVMDWTDRQTCVLFGDGAGATVLGPTDLGRGVLATHLGADGSGADLLRIDAGGSKLPASEETVRNRQHYIKMEGREVFKFAVRTMGEACLKTLDACNMTTDDIDLFVPHQANVRIIDAATDRLKIDKDKVFINAQNYGNTSAASIPIALDEAYRGGRIDDGDIVSTVGFGGGLTWASALMKWIMPKPVE